MDLHQKKFYSDKETDKIINRHAKKNEMGYSEAIRDIIEKYREATVSIPKGYWKSEAGIEQSR